MKRMLCEICQGTEFRKNGGDFVCQGCGTTYSVEDARNLLVEVDESDVAPIVAAPIQTESKGIEPRQLSERESNYLELAKRGLESGNNAEAERYCTLLLEGDPRNIDALLYKGAAVAWQSTFAHLRTDEAIVYWKSAFANITDEDERKKYYKFTDKVTSDVGASLFAVAAGFADSGVYPNTFSTLRSAIDRTISFLLSYKHDVHPAYDPTEILDNGGRTLLAHLRKGAQAIINRFHDQKPTAPTVCTDYHKEVLYFSTICETFGGYGYFTENVRADFYDDGANWFPREADNMGGYVWSDGRILHTTVRTEYRSIFYALDRKAIEMRRLYDEKLTAKFWENHPNEKAAAESEVEELTARLAAIPDRDNAVELVRLLENRIQSVNNFLTRTHTEKHLSVNDSDMLCARASFLEGLGSASDYDSYLNEYPIVKKGKKLLENASSTISKVLSKSDTPSWTFSLPFIATGLGVGGIFGGRALDAGIVVGLSYFIIALAALSLIILFFVIIDKRKFQAKTTATLKEIRKTALEICSTPIYEADRTKVAERKAIQLLSVIADKLINKSFASSIAGSIYMVIQLMNEATPGKQFVEDVIATFDKHLETYNK